MGTRCSARGVGEITLPLGAFVSHREDRSDVAETVAVFSRRTRLRNLGREVHAARQTSRDALRAVQELATRLQQCKGSRREVQDQFLELQKRAKELARENHHLRESFKKDQVNLKVLTQERDRSFDQAQKMLQASEHSNAFSGSQLAAQSLRGLPHGLQSHGPALGPGFTSMEATMQRP